MAAFREINVIGTLRLAKAAIHAGVRRFVFVSSIGVHGRQSNRSFNELDAPAPIDDYAISKLEAELALRELVNGTNLELVIVRPPLVYGSNCPGNFLRLLKLVSSGMPLPFGKTKNCRSLVSVWNLADLLTACVTHNDAAGRGFLVSDMEDICVDDLLRQLAEGMNKTVRLLPINPALLAYTARLFGKFDLYDKVCSNLTVDTRHVHEVLGWAPIITLADGLRSTAQWFEANSGRITNRERNLTRRGGYGQHPK